MKKLLLFVLTAFVTALNAQAQDCPRIFTKGDTLYTDPAPQYQWFRDQNPINGATKQWYLPTKGGNFAVQVSGTTTEFSYTLPAVDKTISGRIIDERYEPIADAVISFGINNVKSDAQGRFTLTGLSGELSTAVVTITKDGFWKNTRRVHFFDQVTAPLTAMLEPLKVTNRFDAQKGATISERGFFLTFPPNSAVTESGQVYRGTINISLKRSFPAEDGFGLRMPGGDFSAIDQNGQEKMLISYGFMSAEMQGSTGEKLKLAPDTEATLEFYIPWEQNKTAPDSMPLWHFDETAGTWKPEGIARKVGPRYVGTVKHFSSWNCDVPRGRATVKGKTRNCKGTLIPNVVINVGQRTVTANANGEYTSYVPSDTEFDVTASVDSITVTPLTEGEEREVKDLAGSAVVSAIGLIDSTGTLTVYGYGVESYSVDSGKTFHQKGDKLTFTKDYPKGGIARDSEGCESNFRILIRRKQGDCQMLDSTRLAQEPQFMSLEQALNYQGTVYKLLSLENSQNPYFLNIFPCLHHLALMNSGLITVPDIVTQLSNLQRLVMNNGRLTDLPETMIQLTKLRSLNLEANSFRQVPEVIARLTNLQVLNLRWNLLLTELPQFIREMPNLRHLSLSGCYNLSTVPEFIGNMTNLELLMLDHIPLKNIPAFIGQLNNLRHLGIAGTQITTIPGFIGQMTKMERLDIGENPLGSLPEFLGQLSNLEYLYLANSDLANLPDFLGQLTKLQYLDLTGNQIASLPESISQLTNLETFWLNRNQLTTLPIFIGQLINLQSLQLDENQLTNLPESIGQLVNLKELNLIDNQLTTLPSSIANLSDNLGFLNLTGNPIPEEEKAKIRSWLPNTNITF